jgi:hypothetical protein
VGKMAYEEFRKKIVNLQSDLEYFKVDFLDRDSFKNFAENLYNETSGFNELHIMGYFSEGIRGSLENIIRVHGRRLRIICQEFDLKARRDQKNLEVMRKLEKAGVEIKINYRSHARFLVAYNLVPEPRGFLVIGSFDFNMECLGKERYDAGIKTRNPDLVASAVKLFDEIWNEPESILFSEKYPEKPALKG